MSYTRAPGLRPWNLWRTHILRPSLLSRYACSDILAECDDPLQGRSRSLCMMVGFQPSALRTLSALLSPPSHAAPGQYPSHHTQGQEPHSMYSPSPQQPWGLVSHDGLAIPPYQLGPCTVAASDDAVMPPLQVHSCDPLIDGSSGHWRHYECHRVSRRLRQWLGLSVYTTSVGHPTTCMHPRTTI
jgi:hypothetical protein